MSAQRQVERFFTEREYFEFEDVSPTRHEYFQGEIFAMAGASEAHNDIALAAAASLKTQLKGRPCRARGADQRIKVAATGLVTYPDVVVVCPPFRHDPELPHTILDAVVIVEVLSSPTAPYDRGGKFSNYKQLPSLRHYILIEQSRIGVEHHWLDETTRNWESRSFDSLDGELRLPQIDCSLLLEDIYEGIIFVS